MKKKRELVGMVDGRWMEKRREEGKKLEIFADSNEWMNERMEQITASRQKRRQISGIEKVRPMDWKLYNPSSTYKLAENTFLYVLY